MAKVLSWRQFLIPADKGGGSLSCAVSGQCDGKIKGLLRVGNRGDTTVLMSSEKIGAPFDVQLMRCSSSGCETVSTLKPIKGHGNRYRVPINEGSVEIDINRSSTNRLDVAVRGLSQEPHILHYHGDRNLVSLGGETPSSLMRGGSKLRVGRSHGYGMFAVEDIKAGEVVEEAPILAQQAPFLTDYTFAADGKYILPLGNIALYNHSENPTCAHTIDTGGKVMTLTATRDVRAGEQLSISYGNELWFSSRGITPLALEE